MMRVLLRAFAKVNYALEVRGLREDGYHDISTIMQSVSLADEIAFERVEKGFELTVEPEGAEVGPVEENTVYRVWRLVEGLSGRELPVKIRLRKKIPAGAGLGGGSADAAAALVGLNELFGLGLSEAELREVGLRIGADVPFCIPGGTALAEGIGEVLSPLPEPPPHHLLITRPAAGANTARVYHAYDRQTKESNPFVAPAVEALMSGNLDALARSLGNHLAPVTSDIVPEVRTLEKELLRAGSLGATMSGSGTAVFGIFDSEEEARAARERSRAPFASVCQPVARGMEMLSSQDRPLKK